MLCYRDMTFCTEETCKKFGDKFDDCVRSLTQHQKNMATKWWGADNGPAPICMFTERPICYEEKEKT